MSSEPTVEDGLSYVVSSGSTVVRTGRTGVLYDQLIAPGKAYQYNGMVFIWVECIESWASLCTPEGAGVIIDTLEINAPVNWAKAVSPFVEMFRRHSPGGVSIPQSVCVWDSRYSIDRTGESRVYRLAPLRHVVDVHADASACEGISGFAIAPISYPLVPREIDLGVPGYVDGFLSSLFDNAIDFLTFRWVLGNAMLDPVQENRVLLMTGPGGSGKSMIASVISACFYGCCGVLPPHILSDAKVKVLPDSILRFLVGCRIVTASEVEFKVGVVNMHVVKLLTGNDLLHHPDFGNLTIRCSATAVLGTNVEIDEDKCSQWQSPAIMRRVIVLPMRVRARNLPPARVPSRPGELCAFAIHCAAYCAETRVMPVSSRVVLTTIFPTKSKLILDYIECDDNSVYAVCLVATDILSHLTGIGKSELVCMASEISSYAVMGGVFGKCLRGLACVSGRSSSWF